MSIVDWDKYPNKHIKDYIYKWHLNGDFVGNNKFHWLYNGTTIRIVFIGNKLFVEGIQYYPMEIIKRTPQELYEDAILKSKKLSVDTIRKEKVFKLCVFNIKSQLSNEGYDVGDRENIDMFFYSDDDMCRITYGGISHMIGFRMTRRCGELYVNIYKDDKCIIMKSCKGNSNKLIGFIKGQFSV